jgi:hypothetical protein
MQLWTYHPTGFQVDAADLIIDPARGQYWRHDEPGFRYQEVFPKLQKLVGTNQFLWCYTVRGQCIRVTEDMELVEWELNVQESHILRFFRSYVWEAIVRSKGDDWVNLFVSGKPEAGQDIHALVVVPLPRGTAQSRGILRPLHSKESLKYAKEVAERSRNLPASERDAYDF